MSTHPDQSVQHQDAHPVVLFDGVCNLCHGGVAWIIRHDPQGRLRFASLQSASGRRLTARAGLPTDHAGLTDSLVLIEPGQGASPGRVRTYSDAALGVASLLGPPWSWLARLGTLLPRPLRDAAYRFIARHRYRLYGRKEACPLPSAMPADVRDRFLQDE